MNDTDLLSLLRDLESDRVERKSSFQSSREEIRQNICALANDLPNHQLPSVLFIGVADNGDCVNLEITDDLLLKLSQYRDNGNIIPFPTMTVQKRILVGCEMVVIIVEPSHSPPVRYRGRAWVRIGPCLAIASPDDERRLSEKRRAGDISFDLQPVHSATLNDLDLELFQRTYLPSAVSFDILDENNRSIELQLASLRFLTANTPQAPTILGLLTVGKKPQDFVYGAYVQFLRINGTELTDPIINQKELAGPLPDLLRLLDDLLELNIATASTIIGTPIETRQPDYPIEALRQLARNAILHRTYEATNAPVRITWLSDRVEIFSPGGLFGQVNEQNFGAGVTDYRKPHIAEVMKNLGYVQRFGFGLPIAEKQMSENGNPPLEFEIRDNSVLAIARHRV